MNNMPHLIKCKNHKLAPWGIVCRHLATGQSREWMAIKSPHPEVDSDFLCEECLVKQAEGDENIDDLMVACIHCMRDMRKKYDPNFELENQEDPDEID